MRQFYDTKPILKTDAEEVLRFGTVQEICDAMVSIAFHEQDWRWAQDRCLSLLESKDSDISGLAAACLGHIARIHRTLDKEKVLSALASHMADPEIGGRVEDAIDDIEMFA